MNNKLEELEWAYGMLKRGYWDEILIPDLPEEIKQEVAAWFYNRANEQECII